MVSTIPVWRAVRARGSARMCVLLSALFVAHASPSTQSPGGDAPLVEVTLVAFRDGHPVTDLQASEVEVRDNGVSHPLVAFTYVDTVTGDTLEPPGHFVLVLDDIGTSHGDTGAAITAGLAFLAALGPEDQLAIENTGPFPLAQAFSTDRPTARQAIRQFLGQRATSRLSSSTREMCRQTVTSLEAIERAVQMLALRPGPRRSVLVVADGRRAYWDGRRQKCSSARKTVARILAASSAADIPLHGADIGAAAPSEPEKERGQESARPSRDEGRELAGPPNQLEALVTETGGTYVRDPRDAVSGVHRVVLDTRQYYRVAYVQPAAARRDRNTPRRVEVRVNRPGVDVRARRWYVAR